MNKDQKPFAVEIFGNLKTYELFNKVNPAGIATLATTLLGYDHGITKDGTIASITFKAKAPGLASFKLDKLEAPNSNAQDIIKPESNQVNTPVSAPNNPTGNPVNNGSTGVTGNTGNNSPVNAEKTAPTTTPATPAVPVAEVSKPVVSENKEFKDIKGHWAATAIKQLSARGIINGYAGGTFNPNQNLTRAEFAAIIARAINVGKPNANAISFTDRQSIPTWAVDAIESVAGQGIFTGDANGKFRPLEPVTRAEIASVIMRVLKASPVQANVEFKDIKPGHWARNAIVVAQQKGIIKGYQDQTFRPDKPATRAEVATMILSMLQKK